MSFVCLQATDLRQDSVLIIHYNINLDQTRPVADNSMNYLINHIYQHNRLRTNLWYNPNREVRT